MKSSLRRITLRAIAVATLSLGSLAVQAQNAVKVGIVGPFSGPFAHYGVLFKNGVEINRFVGIKSKEFLLKEIAKVG